MKKYLLVNISILIIVELMIGLSYRDTLFSLEHLWASSILGIISISFSVFVILPLMIQSKLKRTIEMELGKYVLLKTWGGLEFSFATSGEMLIVAEDNKVYRLKIAKNKIKEKIVIGLDGKVGTGEELI